MKTKVTVELNQKVITGLVKAVGVSMGQAAEAFHVEVNNRQIVPYGIGELQRDSFVKRKSKSRYQIVYDKPYARRLYWHPEYNFRKDRNPNAQGIWLHNFIDGNDKYFMRKAFIEQFKRNAGRLVDWY